MKMMSSVAGPFRTLASWTSAARARSFAASGIDDYKDHYNQVLPINKTIRHTLRIYRMHTSKKNPIAGKITNDGKVADSCKFKGVAGDRTFIDEKELKAGSVFTLSKIKTYEYGGTKYYLKGIREVHIDPDTNEAQPYAKFMMIDSLTSNPVAGTDKSTDKYTKVDSNDVSKVDSISSKDLMYYKEYNIKVNNHTLEGMGVTTVLKPETYLLQNDLTSTEGNKDLVKILGKRTVLVWSQKSMDSVTINVFYVSEDVIPPTPTPSSPVDEEETTWSYVKKKYKLNMNFSPQ